MNAKVLSAGIVAAIAISTPFTTVAAGAGCAGSFTWIFSDLMDDCEKKISIESNQVLKCIKNIEELIGLENQVVEAIEKLNQEMQTLRQEIINLENTRINTLKDIESQKQILREKKRDLSKKEPYPKLYEMVLNEVEKMKKYMEMITVKQLSGRSLKVVLLFRQ